MNLFGNRPLALFCLVFITIGAAIYTLGQEIKLLLLLFFFLCAAVCMLVGILLKKFRIKASFAFLCCFFAIITVASQLLFIDARRNHTLSFEGDREVRMLVISEEYSSEHSGEYRVRIKEIDGRDVSIPATAVCAFPSDITSGDELYARAVIYPAGTEILGYSRNADENVYITVAVYDGAECARLSHGNVSAEILLARVGNAASEYMYDTFGAETSAIARGFLLGDKSGITADVLRDFRRSGVSHLLAVSGLHMSVIIGALEFILRRARVGKAVRCVALSLIAVAFLSMTGFSMSASRSVIMLLSVYFCFLFVKENDSVTALFVSVALIILIFPHSVRDVGLWLSFLATLGILTAYFSLASALHRRRGAGIRGSFLYILEKVLFAILLTFICNAFICIVVWIVFGEMSVMSLLSNLVISPISEIFIIIIPIAMLLGNIPFVGGALVKLLSVIGEGIVWLCGLFSEAHGAVVSLRYTFSGIIIVLMSLSVAVMLIIRLRRKWTVILPPVAAAFAFTVCLVAYNVARGGEVRSVYYSENNNEMIVLSEGYSGAICDISYGSYSFMDKASDIAAENMATEISEYIVTHYHARHPATLEKLFRNTLLRKIYLPYPENGDELGVMESIIECSYEYGVEVNIYKYGERLSLLDASWAAVMSAPNAEGRAHSSISVVIGNGNEILSYIGTGGDSETLGNITSNSDYIIFGKHGGECGGEYGYKVDEAKLKSVFFADKTVLGYSDIFFGNADIFVPREGERRVKFELVLR